MARRFFTRRSVLRFGALALMAGVYSLAITRWIRIDDFVLISRTDVLGIPNGAEKFFVRSDGHAVEVLRRAARLKPEAFVLRLPGNDVRAEEIIDQISTRWGSDRTEVWCFNYPGCGGSDGPARLDAIGPAALAVFDALNRKAAGKPIYLDGNSFGATVALHIAANRPVAGVMLQNPPPIRQMARARFSGPMLWLVVWPVSMQVPDALDPVANGSRCAARAVFIHSVHDADVPDHFQRMIINAYRGRRHEFDLNGNHDTPPETDPADLAAAVNWLRERAFPESHAGL